MRESAVTSHFRLEAAQLGDELWRNNVGAALIMGDDGKEHWVRWGLCNESKKQNEIIKSSDWIGITSTVVTQEMVGDILGIFTAIEGKPSDWHLIPSDKRGHAQKAFHDIVLQAGAYAGFACDASDYRKITGR